MKQIASHRAGKLFKHNYTAIKVLLLLLLKAWLPDFTLFEVLPTGGSNNQYRYKPSNKMINFIVIFFLENFKFWQIELWLLLAEEFVVVIHIWLDLFVPRPMRHSNTYISYANLYSLVRIRLCVHFTVRYLMKMNREWKIIFVAYLPDAKLTSSILPQTINREPLKWAYLHMSQSLVTKKMLLILVTLDYYHIYNTTIKVKNTFGVQKCDIENFDARFICHV